MKHAHTENAPPPAAPPVALGASEIRANERRNRKGVLPDSAGSGAPQAADAQLPVAWISPGIIDPDPRNKRAISEDSEEFKDFMASIQAQGVLQPIIVRPGAGGNRYLIVAGERRWRAARKLRLAAIPAFIRELDDRSAQVIRLTENLQRADLTVLEESAAVCELLGLEVGVRAAANLLGKSPAWVSRRASLAKLSPQIKKDLADPTRPVYRWPAAMLALLAPLPESAQQELVRHRWIETAAQLEREINERYVRSIDKVGWDRSDADLHPLAGACDVCPRRSDDGQHCLELKCFQAKTEAHLRRRVAEIHAQNEALPLVCTGWTDEDKLLAERVVHELGGVQRPKVLPPDAFDLCRKNTPGAVQALAVAGSQAGQKVWIDLRKPQAPAKKVAAPKLTPVQLRQKAYIAAVRTALAKLGEKEWVALGRKPELRTRMLAIAVEFCGIGRFGQRKGTPWHRVRAMALDEASALVWAEARAGIEQELYAYGQPPYGAVLFEKAQETAQVLGLKIEDEATSRQPSAVSRKKATKTKPRHLSRAGKIKVGR